MKDFTWAPNIAGDYLFLGIYSSSSFDILENSGLKDGEDFFSVADTRFTVLQLCRW